MLRKVCESSFWDISIRALVGFLPFRPRLEFTVQAFCIAGEFGIGEADWFAGFVEGLSGSFPVDKVAYLSTKFLVVGRRADNQAPFNVVIVYPRHAVLDWIAATGLRTRPVADRFPGKRVAGIFAFHSVRCNESEA